MKIVRENLHLGDFYYDNPYFGDDNIYTGASWSNNEDDIMVLRVNPDGSVYGSGDDFDFERPNAKEALRQLKQWGYRYIGHD